jgi:hypothetical protein
MQADTRNIDSLIQKSQEAIKTDDVETAVQCDTVLANFLKTANASIESQSTVHANQYDVIFKYRLSTTAYDLFLFLIALGSLYVGWNGEGIMSGIFLGFAVLFGVKWFFYMAKNYPILKMLKNEEDAILQEKYGTRHTYQCIEKIVKYQQETIQDMQKMYEKYRKMKEKEYSGFMHKNAEENSDENVSEDS